MRFAFPCCDAPRLVVKPFEPLPWRCLCGHINGPVRNSCHNCGGVPDD